MHTCSKVPSHCQILTLYNREALRPLMLRLALVAMRCPQRPRPCSLWLILLLLAVLCLQLPLTVCFISIILPTTSEYPEAVSSGIAIDPVVVAALLANTQLSLQDKVQKTKTSILVKVISKPGIVQPIV